MTDQRRLIFVYKLAQRIDNSGSGMGLQLLDAIARNHRKFSENSDDSTYS
jgi:hypothetical protein